MPSTIVYLSALFRNTGFVHVKQNPYYNKSFWLTNKSVLNIKQMIFSFITKMYLPVIIILKHFFLLKYNEYKVFRMFNYKGNKVLSLI